MHAIKLNDNQHIIRAGGNDFMQKNHKGNLQNNNYQQKILHVTYNSPCLDL